MRAPTLVALAFGLALTATHAQPVRADGAPSGSAAPATAPNPGSDVVVATVGTTKITAGELERRMAQLPPFQLQSFGKTPDELRRNFLERVLVREALLAQGSADMKLETRDDVKDRIRTTLRNALLGKMRAEVTAAGVTDDEVKRYYEANAAKFHAPARVAAWRIQVASKEDAAKILVEMKKDLTPKHWNDLARDRSLDKSTSMRGGNLGFIGPDGSTAEPGLKIDDAVVKVLDTVKDAEIVPDPVKDGDRWSVLWRRQSMKAVDRTLETETASIKQLLLHEKTEKKITDTVETLRHEGLKDFAPDLCDALEINERGDIAMKRPAAAPSAPPRKPLPALPKPLSSAGAPPR